jgi:hypothetical protein
MKGVNNFQGNIALSSCGSDMLLIVLSEVLLLSDIGYSTTRMVIAVKHTLSFINNFFNSSTFYHSPSEAFFFPFIIAA